ncbi:MAG: hypothetical protein ACREJ7_02590 [Candidatus Methylomirabilales bacterium]
MRETFPVRLGGLAANLARVKSFSDHPGHGDVVEGLLDESKFFIEWTAPEAGLDVQAELVQLQLQLARWQRAWANIWADPRRRTAVAEQAGAWSERVLEMSGLSR